MASQVLSGANNASYTNNTGQNVRLIINYMSNVTSMTWAGVNVTAESTTIGKDIQNITGEFRRIVPGKLVGTATDVPSGGLTATNSFNEIRDIKTKLVNGMAIYSYGALTGYLSSDGTFITQDYGAIRAKLITEDQKASRNVNRELISTIPEPIEDGPLIHYIPKTISRGGDFPTELMLANGESFSSVCGAFNAIVIKEDGT